MKQEGAEKPLAEQPSKAEAQEQPGPAGAEVKLEHSLEPNQLREEKSEELPVEKWLWIDPLGADATLKSGAVLLAEDIARYVKGYNLLINRNDFEQGPVCGARLKGASYTMTPHPDDAWMFRKNDAGVVEEVALERGRNSDGDYYVVPKNSLVFIKLKQELRVPYYMIGRHNLKINYVYRGLLLGTGPQVDPGYVGNLIIPLHNFTTDDVRVLITDSFVNIDFVRTTPLFRAGEEIPTSLDELYLKCEKTKCLLQSFKVNYRKSLDRYLGGSQPMSQMGKFDYEFKKLSTDAEAVRVRTAAEAEQMKLEVARTLLESSTKQSSFEEKLTGKWETARNFTNLGAVALLGIIIVLLTYFKTDEKRLKESVIELQSAVASTNTATFELRIQQMELSNRQAMGQTSNQVARLSMQISNAELAIHAGLQGVENRVDTLEASMSRLTNRLEKFGITNILGNR